MKKKVAKKNSLNSKLSKNIIEGAKEFKVKVMPSSVMFQLHHDPKHLGFLFARHKIVGKLLSGKNNVLEIGCQDGFGTYLMSKYVGKITAIDIEKKHIDEAKKIWKEFSHSIDFQNIDITKSKYLGAFDSIYMLDVFEHISPRKSDQFLKAVIRHMRDNALLVVGMPTKESQKYASKLSKLGHVNLFSIFEARKYFSKFFDNVLVFGMNDEMINLNFEPLNHYMICICTGHKKL
jgi:2-polyprenyl-3-methyl-5-hydroxy-6-metoxy-1,4-benzoquinol methylase